MYEVTHRTRDGQHMFTPTLRPRIESCLWRAATMAGVTVFGFAFMSNHYHLLAAAAGPREFAWFLQLLHSSLAALVNAERGKQGKVWARRADVVPVSDEPIAQLQRLAYVLANDVREGLVVHPADWPGPHCAHEFQRPDEAAAAGSAAMGQTSDGALTGEGKPSKAEKMRQGYTLPHVPNVRPLPHLNGLPRSQWLGDMRRFCDLIAANPGDREAWMEPHLIDPTLPRPQTSPCRPPCPIPPCPPAPNLPVAVPRATQPAAQDKARARFPVHAFDPVMRRQMQADLEAFHDAYAAASAAFRRGATTAAFPPHCINPDYSRDFVAKARFPKRAADAPGAAQRGALAVRRSEQRGRKTRGARKASLQQKES
jgi:hypothetical protein